MWQISTAAELGIGRETMDAGYCEDGYNDFLMMNHFLDLRNSFYEMRITRDDVSKKASNFLWDLEKQAGAVKNPLEDCFFPVSRYLVSCMLLQ